MPTTTPNWVTELPAIIGAIGAAIAVVIGAMNHFKAIATAVKVDRVAVVADNTMTLADGTLQAQLDQNVATTATLARLTKEPGDIEQAAAAKKKADDHRAALATMQSVPKAFQPEP